MVVEWEVFRESSQMLYSLLEHDEAVPVAFANSAVTERQESHGLARKSSKIDSWSDIFEKTKMRPHFV